MSSLSQNLFRLPVPDGVDLPFLHRGPVDPAVTRSPSNVLDSRPHPLLLAIGADT